MAHAGRIVVENPGGRTSKPKERGNMAGKRRPKKRSKGKRKNPAKKRTTHRRKGRRSNPSSKPRRRSSHRRRSSRKNPHRRARRAHARRSRRNPSTRRHFRRSSHRPRRRNPGIGAFLTAAAIGALGFVLTDVATFYATSDMAKNGPRNRKIIAGVAALAGLYIAVKKDKPLLGLGLGLGALLAGFGNDIDLAVLRLLPAKSSGVTAVNAPKTAGLGALAYQGGPRMLGMGATSYNDMRGMGAVAYDNMQAVAYDNMQGYETLQGMGDPVPDAPWESENPFGR